MQVIQQHPYNSYEITYFWKQELEIQLFEQLKYDST
jgi:hypothetical protein